jgi:hypothetical protein
MKLSRSNTLAEKVVFVDGLPGCGKTLFSSIVSSLNRVELLSYAFEIENTCILHTLGKLPIDAAKAMVDIQVDLKLYNTMMGRDVNFRISDLSSVFQYHSPGKYLKRIASAGDEYVPESIKKESPILNLSVHNLIEHSLPILESSGNKYVFIEVVRHPLYMIRQEALNMGNLLGSTRDFSIYYSYNNDELPYYIKGWEKEYYSSNPVERAILFFDKLTRRTEKAKSGILKKYKDRILTIPFESFVLNPHPWLERIENYIGSNSSTVTNEIMKEQNIPREMVAQGIDIEIYRRCGWKPPKDGNTERDELNIRREEAAQSANNNVIKVLDEMCRNYEEKYWKPDE